MSAVWFFKSNPKNPESRHYRRINEIVAGFQDQWLTQSKIGPVAIPVQVKPGVFSATVRACSMTENFCL